MWELVICACICLLEKFQVLFFFSINIYQMWVLFEKEEGKKLKVWIYVGLQKCVAFSAYAIKNIPYVGNNLLVFM